MGEVGEGKSVARTPKEERAPLRGSKFCIRKHRTKRSAERRMRKLGASNYALARDLSGIEKASELAGAYLGGVLDARAIHGGTTNSPISLESLFRYANRLVSLARDRGKKLKEHTRGPLRRICADGFDGVLWQRLLQYEAARKRVSSQNGGARGWLRRLDRLVRRVRDAVLGADRTGQQNPWRVLRRRKLPPDPAAWTAIQGIEVELRSLKTAIPKAAPADDLDARLVTYLVKNPGATREELAEEAGISKRHLRRRLLKESLPTLAAALNSDRKVNPRRKRPATQPLDSRFLGAAPMEDDAGS